MLPGRNLSHYQFNRDQVFIFQAKISVILQNIFILMMQKSIRIVLLAVVLLLTFNAILPAQEWKFIKERDGIKIYTRSDEINPVKSYRGETDLNTSMEEISKIIGRIESFDWWDESISEINVLAYEEEKYIRYYLVYDVQWPFDDRDLCVESIITNDPVTGRRVVYATPLPDVIPEKPGKVRIKNYWQQWIMEPVNDSLIHVTLEGSVDPGGNIPTWVINLVITDTPLNIMKKVRDQVEKTTN